MFIKTKTKTNDTNVLININHIIKIYEINKNKINIVTTDKEIHTVEISLKEIKKLVNNEMVIKLGQ